VVEQKRDSGNSYYLTEKGRAALRTLIVAAQLSEPSLTCKPIGTKLSRYILPKIIKQYHQDRIQEAVSISSWTKFFRYYYDKLSIDQQQKFVKKYYGVVPILYGNYGSEYLTTDPPYPRVATVSQTISPQQIAELMWSLDYGKPNQEQKFKDTIEGSNSMAIAFSLAACDPDLQDWLVFRLIRSLKHRKLSDCLEINLTYNKESRFPEWSLTTIWKQISEQLESFTELDDFARYIDRRFVIIKVRKTQISHQKILIDEFWHPLLRQLNSNNGGRQNNLCLLLFIVNDRELPLDDSYQVYCLEPILSIGATDIIRWAETQEVSTYLEKDKGKRKFNDWKKVKVPALDCSLPKIFKTLIAYMNPEVVLDDVAQSWKIGGS
jgi:hypothetical protein